MVCACAIQNHGPMRIPQANACKFIMWAIHETSPRPRPRPLPTPKKSSNDQPTPYYSEPLPTVSIYFLSRPTKKELARREYMYRGLQKCSQVRGQVSRDVERFFHSVNDVERLRKGALLQRFSIWHGHVRARHSVHWSIQVVECRTFHDASADL